jgi:ferric-dicitrate binding protein FerR (iron transport regulator)
MMSAPEKIRRILDEYFAGALSGALEERICGWLVDNRHREEKDRALEEKWNEQVAYEETPGKFARNSVDGVFARIGLPQAEQGKRVVAGWRRTMFRVAAVMIPLLVAGGAVVWMLGRQEPVWITEVADAGVQQQIELPDGSQVWLNPNSEVSYPPKFKKREVRLTGEAFFDVVKNDEAPFTVSAGELNVTVHGTRFEVVAREDKDRSTVTLHSGSVAVAAGEAEMTLEPGNQLQYYHDEGAVRVENVELGEWGKPSLDFYEAALEEIFFALEANYGVALRVDGALPAVPRYTVRFSHEQPVDEVLQLLERLTRSFTSSFGEDNNIDITLVPRT